MLGVKQRLRKVNQTISALKPASSSFEQGFEIVVFPCFYRTLAIVVHNKGALLCLLRGMVTDLNQSIDNMVKSVDIIIKQHDFVLLFDVFFYQKCFRTFFLRAHHYTHYD